MQRVAILVCHAGRPSIARDDDELLLFAVNAVGLPAGAVGLRGLSPAVGAGGDAILGPGGLGLTVGAERRGGRQQRVEVEQVAHPLLLCLEVGEVLRVGRDVRRDALDDAQTKPGESEKLFRVIRDETHVADAEVGEDLRACAVLARVNRQTEFSVGVHRVEAALLQGVGMDLGAQANAAPLLSAQVEQHAVAVSVDALQRLLELRAAVAAERAEDVAGAALRVRADERCPALAKGRVEVFRVALDEGDVLDAVDLGAIAVRHEEAKLGRHPRRRAALLDSDGVPPLVRDEVGSRGVREPPSRRGVPQRVETARRQRRMHANRWQAADARQLDHGLRRTRSVQHAALARACERHRPRAAEAVLAAACARLVRVECEGVRARGGARHRARRGDVGGGVGFGGGVGVGGGVRE
mmetsp:Transcript_10325/g.21915  ORF Transcript_10325/g.21915 Transcript_10325/m.21915 type:complete len:411 (-) Transcript_10325:76-1308(-)